MKRCSYCGGDGHDRSECRWPRWHARHGDLSDDLLLGVVAICFGLSFVLLLAVELGRAL